MQRESEFELIERFAARLGTAPRACVGIGDDCAVLPASGAAARDFWLFAADMLIEDVHFRSAISSPEDVGWKALAVNVSDVAAMGGDPWAATVSLGLPRPGEAEALVEGVRQCAEAYGLDVVGGDTTRSPDRLVVDVAILGRVRGREPVTRGGAAPGNLVCVTGPLGGAAAGLRVAEADPAEELPAGIDAAALIDLHRRPSPRPAAGRLLAACGATAMIDLSDGLAADAAHLASRSGVAVRIDGDRVPAHPEAAALLSARGEEPLALALHGGDDYELLACLEPGRLEGARARLEEECGLALSVVGRCEAGSGVRLVRHGRSTPLARGGWDHFVR